MNRFNFWAGSGAWLLLLLAASHWVVGQQGANPFADRSSATPPPATADVSQVPAVTAQDRTAVNALLLKQLADSNPTAPAELMRAVRTLMDLEEFAEAQSYLAKLAALQLEDAEWFRLADAVGSDFLLRLYAEPQMAPTGREFVQRLNEVSFRYGTSPERIDQLIRGLSDPDSAQRSDSFRQLRRLEQPAAAALLNIFADDGRRDEYLAVRQALRGMGATAMEPLLAACGATRLQVRYEALLALARRTEPAAFDAAVGALFAPDTADVVKEDIAKALQETYPQLPEREAALQRMYERAQDLLYGRQGSTDRSHYDRDSVYVNAWIWNAESNRLESILVAPATAARMLAADRAEDLHAIEPANPSYRQLHLLAYLDASKRVAGPHHILDYQQVTQKFAALDLGELEQLLSKALDEDLIPAAAGACDLMGQHPDLCPWLTSGQGSRQLIRALQCGDRHTQFAAFQALANADCQTAYPGSSFTMAAAAYFASFADRPSGLIGHHYADVAQGFADVLRQSGISGRGAASSREMFDEAIHDANLRYLFISDTLVQPPYNELFQQLRADWRTKRLPTAIVVRGDSLERARRQAAGDPFAVVVPETMDPTLVALQVDQLRRLQQPWEVTTAQGRLQAEFALNWILKVLEEREKYAYLDAISHEQALANLLYWPHNSQRVIRALGLIGTASAQGALIEYASQPGMPIENRQFAVESFAHAIGERGVLLTRNEIQRQYDRYNAATGDSGENQRILGLILDLLEARRKR